MEENRNENMEFVEVNEVELENKPMTEENDNSELGGMVLALIGAAAALACVGVAKLGKKVYEDHKANKELKLREKEQFEEWKASRRNEDVIDVEINEEQEDE